MFNTGKRSDEYVPTPDLLLLFMLLLRILLFGFALTIFGVLRLFVK